MRKEFVVILNMNNSQITAVILISLLFAVGITFIVLKYVVKFTTPVVITIDPSSYVSADLSKLSKISSQPFLFGLEKKIVNPENLYFDENNLYAVNTRGQIAAFALQNVVELKRSSTKINNSVVWQLKLKQNDETEAGYSFTPNYSIGNKNFHRFYLRLQEVNPNAIKSKWSLWKM